MSNAGVTDSGNLSGKRTGRKPKLKAGEGYLAARERRANAKPPPKKANYDALSAPSRVGVTGKASPQKKRVSVAYFVDQICKEQGVNLFRDLLPDRQLEIQELAQARFDAFNEMEGDEDLKRAFDRVNVKWGRKKPKRIKPMVELAAMRRTPAAEAVRAVLGKRTSGVQSGRELRLAAFELITYGKESPEIMAALERLTEASEITQYAFDNVAQSDGSKDLNNLYITFSRMLWRARDSSDVLIDENLKMVKELAKGRDKFGMHLTIDGTMVPAALSQAPAGSNTAVEEAHRRNKEVGLMVRSKKVARGWYCVVIVDCASGIPLIWKFFPGQEMKLDHVTDLLADLKRRWKECPVDSIVGDGEYAASADLAFNLEFAHGIHPIFPINKELTRHSEWSHNEGVPEHCGQLMTLNRPKEFATQHLRDDEELEPGDFTENFQARMEWYCPVCQTSEEKHTEATYVKQDPQYHTFYPRAGKSLKAIKRRALELKRNWSECVFSQLKRRGKALQGSGKAFWMDEKHEAEWHVGGALMAITMSRYIHETGLYEEVFDEMDDKGLLGST